MLVQLRSLTAEGLLGLLVEIGNGDASSQDLVVRVLGGHGSCRLSGKVVELDSCDARVEAVDDFLGDLGLFGNRNKLNSLCGDINGQWQIKTYWINVVHVEAIAELDDSRGDLVKKDVLLATI